jgi:hypothetical protein
MPDSLQNTIASQPGRRFSRYFTLDEAASLIPVLCTQLNEARAELAEVRNDVILYKRILLLRKKVGQPLSTQELALLKRKFERYGQAVAFWIGRFSEQGILLRDIREGLLDFPYHARSTGQDYLLCWRQAEDGIFYFHELETGFQGRKPIVLLPD